MDLYLVQHGEAKDERADPERGLTQKGKSVKTERNFFCFSKLSRHG